MSQIETSLEAPDLAAGAYLFVGAPEYYTADCDIAGCPAGEYEAGRLRSYRCRVMNKKKGGLFISKNPTSSHIVDPTISSGTCWE